MLSEDEDTTTANTSQEKKSLEISLYREFSISELKAAEMHTQNPEWNMGITWKTSNWYVLEQWQSLPVTMGKLAE